MMAGSTSFLMDLIRYVMQVFSPAVGVWHATQLIASMVTMTDGYQAIKDITSQSIVDSKKTSVKVYACRSWSSSIGNSQLVMKVYDLNYLSLEDVNRILLHARIIISFRFKYIQRVVDYFLVLNRKLLQY